MVLHYLIYKYCWKIKIFEEPAKFRVIMEECVHDGWSIVMLMSIYWLQQHLSAHGYQCLSCSNSVLWPKLTYAFIEYSDWSWHDSNAPPPPLARVELLLPLSLLSCRNHRVLSWYPHGTEHRSPCPPPPLLHPALALHSKMKLYHSNCNYKTK